jgi:predicted metal-dependent phosphoesterase TrpH
LIRIDLQVHSTAGSPDSSIDPSELAHACAAARIDGVALTEHLPGVLDDARETLNREGLLLIPAREVSYLHAHLLVLSIDEDFLGRLPRRVTDAGDLVQPNVALIWAHPGAPSGSSAYAINLPDDRPFRDFVHGVEILNGRHLHFPQAVEVARSLKESTGSGGTGGSDAHIAQDVGRAFTLIDADRDVAATIDAIRDGKVRPVLSAAWAETHDYHYRPSLEEFLA